MPELIYRRHAVGPRQLALALLVWALFVAALVLLLLGKMPAAAGAALVVVLAVIGAVWLWLLVVMERLGQIRLTRGQLRVGRSGMVQVADLDVGWVRMLGSERSPRLHDRVESAPGPVAFRTATPQDAPTLGGVLGRLKDFGAIDLRLRDRTFVQVVTNDEEGLLAGLLTAVGS